MKFFLGWITSLKKRECLTLLVYVCSILCRTQHTSDPISFHWRAMTFLSFYVPLLSLCVCLREGILFRKVSIKFLSSLISDLVIWPCMWRVSKDLPQQRKRKDKQNESRRREDKYVLKKICHLSFYWQSVSATHSNKSCRMNKRA